jgi:hypothetical protein
VTSKLTLRSVTVVWMACVPWLNTSFRAQYTLYGRFDGGVGDYDGTRDAWNNDALSLLRSRAVRRRPSRSIHRRDSRKASKASSWSGGRIAP